ncbi:ImmA/IrrE family metallo-endopeptidase [Carnobacterium gallinarum]|uniref:ImmA/IrrE family metallo-endopeptidase n=1 Tax=Carnobacterium gallinarum TaxID=2749 RepID=UPI000558EDC2|nr:ImmA/IrrE family metallo-endopeptidase [Carnobacterium gallinarum]
MNYEQLLNYVSEEFQVYEVPLIEQTGSYGFFINGKILIEENQSEIEKKCILAEEYGHGKKNSGNILDQQITVNRKQELLARKYAHELLIPLKNLVKAKIFGCSNLFELADYLEVTEDFLSEALAQYKLQYGEEVIVDDYKITFEPFIEIALLKENSATV